jgi:hypothetical protein
MSPDELHERIYAPYGVTPLLADAARPCRHSVANRWQVDETYVRVAGRWRYVYQAIDQSGRSSTSMSPRGATPRPSIASLDGRSVRRRSRRLRSPPIRRRCTRPCWRTCCRRPGTAPTSTPTIGRVRPREAAGAAGSDARAQTGPQCQGGHRRTCLGVQNLRRDTTSWRFKSRPTGEWRSHSTNWSWRSDPAEVGLQPSLDWRNATAPPELPRHPRRASAGVGPGPPEPTAKPSVRSNRSASRDRAADGAPSAATTPHHPKHQHTNTTTMISTHNHVDMAASLVGAGAVQTDATAGHPSKRLGHR